MGATGLHICIGKGLSPDRVDLLFGFVTPATSKQYPHRCAGLRTAQ